MSILFETNKFHHGGFPCSGGLGEIGPVVTPPLNLALQLRYNLLLALSVAAE